MLFDIVNEVFCLYKSPTPCVLLKMHKTKKTQILKFEGGHAKAKAGSSTSETKHNKFEH